MRVKDILPAGRANAISGTDLARILNLKNKRDLTQMIERERRSGQPICATTNRGYYLADSPEEMAQYIESLSHRIHQVTVTKLHCEETLSKMKEGDDDRGQ